MTPTDLRALAARVLAEEPSDEFRDAVLIALGWSVPKIRSIHEYWYRPDGSPCHKQELPNPLTSHDAAFAAMPAGWRYRIGSTTDNGTVYAFLWLPGAGLVVDAEAPDLPRALTAAGLLAGAVDAEQGDGA